MFAFPNVAGLAEFIPPAYLERHGNRGDAVAEFLLDQQKVAVVPGSTYGLQGNDCIRLVLCGGEPMLQDAINRMAAVRETAVASRSNG